MRNRARTILLRFRDKEGGHWIGAAFLADLKREGSESESITLSEATTNQHDLAISSLNVVEDDDRVLVFTPETDQELLEAYTEWINTNAAHHEGVHIEAGPAVADFLKERGNG